jgi:hypothetical protein
MAEAQRQSAYKVEIIRTEPVFGTTVDVAHIIISNFEESKSRFEQAEEVVQELYPHKGVDFKMKAIRYRHEIKQRLSRDGSTNTHENGVTSHVYMPPDGDIDKVYRSAIGTRGAINENGELITKAEAFGACQSCEYSDELQEIARYSNPEIAEEKCRFLVSGQCKIGKFLVENSI